MFHASNGPSFVLTLTEVFFAKSTDAYGKLQSETILVKWGGTTQRKFQWLSEGKLYFLKMHILKF